MNRLSAALAMVAALTVGCTATPGFEFRDADRPSFARTVSLEELEAGKASGDVVVLDVRLREDFAANPVLIPGALYRDPEAIADWSSQLPRDKTVVVYCVKGKWVSQKAATYLDAQGFEVYSLDGGIEAWSASAESAP